MFKSRRGGRDLVALAVYVVWVVFIIGLLVYVAST